MSLYDKLFPPRVITLKNGKTVSQPTSRMPLVILLVLLMLLPMVANIFLY